jgi:hypothetical protein
MVVKRIVRREPVELTLKVIVGRSPSSIPPEDR